MKTMNEPTPHLDRFPTIEELYSESHRKKGNLTAKVAGCTGTLSGLRISLEVALKHNGADRALVWSAVETLEEVVEKLRNAREESY
tara:strand:- start:13 stop:270 length:258 start_codon:yes stop_codon:yes gene_type:complete